jgi:D-alanyl-lipoteichoic acid acyltransferase DltB (MBOAT superfamily)
MLFNSSEYLLVFLPFTALAFHMLSPASANNRANMWLVLASMLFYASWKPLYLILILSSILCNFSIGKRIAGNAGQLRKSWLVAGVCFNLGLLGYFKYAGFFIDSLNALGGWLIPMPHITLPLAISFFSFQQIAYLVDVAREDCQDYQLRHYALFVLFFPQLIAGPIVHHKEMMPQFDKGRERGKIPTDYAVGITFIAIGLFKKVILADSLAQVADPVFDAAGSGTAINSLDAWLAMFAFSFQIYFDFSGYSDIAIGSARLFGITLPENFRSPYKASSVIEIWHRWHMTLSRFLRDYLYIALGGNRNGPINRYRNLVLTMLLGGLWHGAAWTFVIWGALHGLYLCINHAWRAINRRLGTDDVFSHAWFRPLFIALTFLAWSFAMVIFRASDMNSAMAIVGPMTHAINQDSANLLSRIFDDALLLQLMSTYTSAAGSYTLIYTLLGIAAAICWLMPNTQQVMASYRPVIVSNNEAHGQGNIRWSPRPIFAIATGLAIGISVLGVSTISRFIYFQF